MSKTYILQKDLPGLKAGAPFVYDGDRFYDSGQSDIYGEVNHYIPECVENNPEWFLPEENKNWVCDKHDKKEWSCAKEHGYEFHIKIDDFMTTPKIKKDDKGAYLSSHIMKGVCAVNLDWELKWHPTDIGQVMTPAECRFIGNGKECMEFIEKYKPKEDNNGYVLIHSVQRKDGRIIAIGDDEYKQGTVHSMRVGDNRGIYAYTESGIWGINELEDEPVKPKAENKKVYKTLEQVVDEANARNNKPDWEIVYMRGTAGRLHPYNWQSHNCERENCSINSVKRLSDQITFSVDEITDGGNKIHAFEIIGNVLKVHMQAVSDPKEGWLSNIQSLVKKQEPKIGHADWFEKLATNAKKKLFTTEDGVDIVSKLEDVFVVYADFSVDFNTFAAEVPPSVIPPSRHKIFSTKEAAEKYIAENKPQPQKEEQKIDVDKSLNISMREIASCVTIFVYQGRDANLSSETSVIDWRKLDELIKAKQKSSQ